MTDQNTLSDSTDQTASDQPTDSIDPDAEATRDPDVDVTEAVEHFDTGVSITAKVKRGSGTRDQDEFRAKVKRREYRDAREEMDAAIKDLKRWSQQARDIQPADPEEDGED